MATSQQGKKKKKVLSQQQIDKLLVMLKEEDKPLRAAILAKALGYQSAKDINATLLRLEGYGMVTRIMMNNTPLWKFSGREAATPLLAAPPEEVSDEARGGNISLVGGVPTMAAARTALENGSLQQGVETREDSRPSRPQSTKADLEWDPTDIQSHHPHNGAGDSETLADYHPHPEATAYGDGATTESFTALPHTVECTTVIKTQVTTADIIATTTPTSTFDNDQEETNPLTFTSNRDYSEQDLYTSVNTRQERVSVNLNANKVSVKSNTVHNYANTDYSVMSGYGQPTPMNLGPMSSILATNVAGGMQPGYSVDYNQPTRSNTNTATNSTDMYMLANTNIAALSSGVCGSTGSSNLQHTFQPTHNQTHDYAGSSTYATSVNCANMAPKTGVAGGPNMAAYSRDSLNQVHNVNHYNQTSYNTNTNTVTRTGTVVPTYIVQEIMKPDGVGQYGMSGPQQENAAVSGYQPFHHHHHHHHHMDGSQGVPFSQQAYHNNSGMNNAAPPTQLQQHHHHHAQQQQHQMVSQHHHHQPQQQPLAQAANFVNVGTFSGGTYNQLQGNFGMGSSNRGYSGQHQGAATYNSGNVNSKDFSGYAGTGGGFHSNQHTIKRHHFSGYTPSGVYPQQMRPQMYNKLGQMRPPFPGPGFTQPERPHRGNSYNRGRLGVGQGRNQRYQNGRPGGDSKGKQQSNSSSDKGSPKTEVNKYMGTEVLDDICRRLAQQSNTQQNNGETPTEGCVDSEQDKEKLSKKETSQVKNDAENQNNKLEKTSQRKAPDREHNPDNPSTGKIINGRENGAISRQNGYRNYSGRHHQYPSRGGYYGHDNTRHHHRNGPRHPETSRHAGGRTLEPGRYTKPSIQGQGSKSAVSPSLSANGKAGGSEGEKDTKQGVHDDKTLKPEFDKPGQSKESEETPLLKHRNLLADHLDPNNVLLSHLFVKGLIDRVLVDQVRLMKTRRDAIERLVPILLKTPKPAVMSGFSDALQKSGQGYLAELIKGTGVESEEMTEQHVSLLELHRQNIAASMIPDKDLLASLLANSVLTPDLHKFVYSQPSRAQQIESLLQVLPLRGDKAFETFRMALRKSGQPWLAEQITMELS